MFTKKRSRASEWGVYLPIEIDFLRSVVQEGLQTCDTDLDKKRAETIARNVLNAYRHGVVDRTALLELAWASSSVNQQA